MTKLVVPRSIEAHKNEDVQFVADLISAFEKEKNLERKVLLGMRIAQLMLKGVRFERLEMRNRKTT
jgi:hypothetical protein